MVDIKEIEQTSLLLSQEDSEFYPAQPLLSKRPWCPGRICLWLLVLEMTNVVAFWLGYVFHSRIGLVDIDEYASLSRQNISWDFTVPDAVLHDKLHPLFHFSESWNGTRKHHGIVAVERPWATRQRLPPSAPAPEQPDLLLYQIDVFHALHCLDQIRIEFDQPQPSAGYHVGHCIEHVKNSLMCNADVTLSALDKEHFLQAEASYAVHQCRDFGSIVRWFEAHEWRGLTEWMAKFHHDHLHNSEM
ncbi:hypothetical protein VHEMI10329 [[Torrubiella] hemipterigena]|uniref:Tat pathway signal sequence n=1 Tax=[Torrubiella] hemipterigena TaxID=1531966 RepID=A0A0A1TRP4_9HYPO|nr:hypothetical protein VHEMI10329 [[Torrubiella] hemipterigena]